MNYKCLVCFVETDAERCPEHRAKWQRRFFYPCKYCGLHVKSYKAKRCNRPACFSRAMREAAGKRFPNMRERKAHREYAHGEFTHTATGWARAIGVHPSVVTYHLRRGKSITEIIKRFEARTLALIKSRITNKGGKHAR